MTAQPAPRLVWDYRSTTEPDIAHVIDRVLEPGDGFVDVGACVGEFSVLAAQKVGEYGAVLAIEPDEKNCEICLNNAKGTRTQDIIHIVQKPAWSGFDRVIFYRQENDFGGHATDWNPREHPDFRGGAVTSESRIATTVWNEWLQLRDSKPTLRRWPKLIKIDTEGADHRVLVGCAILLQHVPFILCELHEFGLGKLGSSQDALRTMMVSLGFETWTIFCDGSLPRLVPPTVKVHSSLMCNLLFAKERSVTNCWSVCEHDAGWKTAGLGRG